MQIAPLDSLLAPRLKSVSLLTGVPSILGLAHSWIARWSIAGALEVVDCSGAFEPLRVLHALEDRGISGLSSLESIQVHRPRTALQFLGASRILAAAPANPVVILAPLYQVVASSSSSAASGLLLDGFLDLLSSARVQRTPVLIVEPEKKNSALHQKCLGALQAAAQRTWCVSARGVESAAGSALPARASNRSESIRAAV